MKAFSLVSFFIALLFSASVYAGKVVKVDGDVVVFKAGSETSVPVTKKTKLEWGDTVQAESGHLVGRFGRLKFALKGKFKSVLEKKTDKKKRSMNLVYGQIRAKLSKMSAKDKASERFRIKTPSALAGVRGTDFMFSYLPLLGESEIICFEGELSFRTSDDSSEQKVKTGQWGGHGGRFGAAIDTPIDLPKNVLEHFDNSLGF